MQQYDGSIRINTEINSKNASAQLMTLENRIVKTADKIASLRSKMDALKDTKAPTEEYKALDEYIKQTETSIDDLTKSLRRLEGEGLQDSDVYRDISSFIEEMSAELERSRAKMQDLVDTGKAFTLGQDTEEYAKLGQQLKYAENDLAALTQRHSELINKQNNISSNYKKLGVAAKKAFSTVRSAITKAGSSNKAFSSMGMGLKSILKYGLGISGLYALVNKLRSAIKEGYENLYNDNEKFKNSIDSLKASATTLKNSLAAAFRPLVDIAIPYIQTVMDYMADLLNSVGHFFAAITGQKTYTKAIKQTTAALKEGKKAAEGYLSPLDEINKYKTKDADSTAATGVMFEEVPITAKFENIAQWIKEMWENADFTDLGNLIGTKLRDALDNIPWTDIKEKREKDC